MFIILHNYDVIYSQYQVVPWQEYSFELDQMVSVRLAGVMSPTIDRTPPIPNHLKVASTLLYT